MKINCNAVTLFINLDNDKKIVRNSRLYSGNITPNNKMKSKYDVAIIGAGHNGLIAAAYLAKSGMSVGVFEKRHLIGGAAVTEEIFPGYKFSRASYVLSLLRPKIINELNLKRYGLELLERNTSSFTPMLEDAVNGKPPRSLTISNDLVKTFEEISKFSSHDAKNFFEYEKFIGKMAAGVNFILDERVSFNNSLFNTIKMALPIAKLVRELGSDTAAFYELITSPITKILNQWFESEPLKATLATDGVIGAMLSPSTGGSGYVLLHHMIGETNGKKGSWAYVKGGMGSVSNSIASCCRDHNVDIFVSKGVKEVAIHDEKVNGIILEDETFIEADCVVSNATPHVTFNNLMTIRNNTTKYFQNVAQMDYTSPVTKINVAVDSLPNFAAIPNKKHNEIGEQHKGTIHLNCEHSDLIHKAFVDATNGFPSKRPMIEMCIPSALDDSLAPKGHHVISLFTQFTPIKLNFERAWTAADKEAYANTIFDTIEEYAPGFKNSIVGTDVLTPADLEDIFGLTGGNIFHGAMSLDQLLVSRPTSVLSSHETPLQGLFLCGSGTHPGGGVMGSCGRLAAMCVSEKRR